MPKGRMRTLLEFRLDLDCRTISTWTSRSDRRNCDTIVTFQWICIRFEVKSNGQTLAPKERSRKKMLAQNYSIDIGWNQKYIYKQSVPIQQIIKASNYIHIYTYLIVFVYNWKLLDSAELVAGVWTNTRKQPGEAKKRQLRPSDHTADSSASYSPGLPVVETFLACAAQKEVLLAGDRILDTAGVIIPQNPLANRLLWVAFFSAARRSPSPCRHISDS